MNESHLEKEPPFRTRHLRKYIMGGKTRKKT
jgi:hypothetical protein